MADSQRLTASACLCVWCACAIVTVYSFTRVDSHHRHHSQRALWLCLGGASALGMAFLAACGVWQACAGMRAPGEEAANDVGPAGIV